jgi:capsular exopolysaccharide synthesis family protein
LPETRETIAADWIQPPQELEGLQRFVETVRERIRVIIAIVVITTAVAILYVVMATKVYEAEAELLIAPCAGDDPVLRSLCPIPESTDPTRDVETASRLVANIDVAERVKRNLESSLSPEELLKKVEAEPVPGSNIVAVTARETSPQGAQELADGFADAAVDDLTQRLHERIDAQLPSLEAQPPSEAVDARIAQLTVLRSGPDPTIRVQTHATLPTSQASPKPALSIALGIIGGLVLGVGGAFAFQVFDPRLRREEQLRRLYRLPILGRIPLETQSRSADKPIVPRQMSTATGEAYRTLRATLAGTRRGEHGRVIMVTGSSPSEGKTTTAINLATSLALAGQRVILIESDLRRPVLADALGVHPRQGGVVSVLIENTTLAESLTPSSTYGSNLQLLFADYEGGWITELFSISTAERMIGEARQLADYVIVDSPPLNEVVDALPLAKQADAVLIVVRLGATRLDKLRQLGELLAENGVRPVGFAIVGTARPKRREYHYYAEAPAGLAESGNRRQLVGSSETDT